MTIDRLTMYEMKIRRITIASGYPPQEENS